MTGERARVLSALGTGRPHAMTLDVLAARAMVDRRTAEACVQELVLAGEPICSATKPPWGIYKARDASEAFDGYWSLRRRHKTTGARVWALRRTARRMREEELGLERGYVAQAMPWAKEEAA